ncbi:glycosyltransferase [Chitinophagaceae bacterium MMS25-I14]
MSRKKHIVLTVTTDPNFDQRMIRICTSLHNAGYDVTLIGRERPISKPLIGQPFKQVRIRQNRDSGKLFYVQYNTKLFFRLLFRKMDAICAIDLDTILPVYYISKLRRKPRVYDAHELFTEMEEVVTRPSTQKMWYWIEKHTVPDFKYGYTVNKSYVDEYRRMYGVDYAIVRNATVLKPLTVPEKKQKYILYQGAVNKGRCFEQLIPAMLQVDAHLIICGEGNFYKDAQQMVRDLKLEDKVSFKGFLPPNELQEYTLNAWVGITLFVATSRSNELSLANRFFDYMHHGVPQLAARYPEYENINSEYEIATLLDTITPDTVAAALNRLLQDEAYYRKLQENCLNARKVYCWQEEEKRLLAVYEKLFAHA